MKKSKFLELKINPADYRDEVRKRLTRSQWLKLQTALLDRKRTLRQHFKKDGWDLSYRLIEEDIYGIVFGDRLPWYVIGRLMEGGPWVIESGEHEWMLRDPNKRAKRVKKRPTKRT